MYLFFQKRFIYVCERVCILVWVSIEDREDIRFLNLEFSGSCGPQTAVLGTELQ